MAAFRFALTTSNGGNRVYKKKYDDPMANYSDEKFLKEFRLSKPDVDDLCILL